MKQPDFVKILQEHITNFDATWINWQKNEMLEAMEAAWNAAVDKCAETAKVFCNAEAMKGYYDDYYEVDKQSIIKNKIE